MDTTTSGTTAEYDRLIARHHAMRLRRQLLTPTSPFGPDPAGVGVGAYGGAADQRLIRRDLGLLEPLSELIDHLYAVMFRRRPYLRPLFPASMEFQQAHLERILRHLVDHLHHPAELASTLRQLGRDHRKLGVRPVHYEAFEEALCAAIRHRAAARWTEEMEAAWVRMLRFAVAAMTAGADSALTEPPYWHAVVTGHERRRPDLAVLRVRTGEPYPYRAGQYGTVEHPTLPHTWRQYSMGCAPLSTTSWSSTSGAPGRTGSARPSSNAPPSATGCASARRAAGCCPRTTPATCCWSPAAPAWPR